MTIKTPEVPICTQHMGKITLVEVEPTKERRQVQEGSYGQHAQLGSGVRTTYKLHVRTGRRHNPNISIRITEHNNVTCTMYNEYCTKTIVRCTIKPYSAHKQLERGCTVHAYNKSEEAVLPRRMYGNAEQAVRTRGGRSYDNKEKTIRTKGRRLYGGRRREVRTRREQVLTKLEGICVKIRAIRTELCVEFA